MVHSAVYRAFTSSSNLLFDFLWCIGYYYIKIFYLSSVDAEIPFGNWTYGGPINHAVVGGWPGFPKGKGHFRVVIIGHAPTSSSQYSQLYSLGHRSNAPAQPLATSLLYQLVIIRLCLLWVVNSWLKKAVRVYCSVQDHTRLAGKWGERWRRMAACTILEDCKETKVSVCRIAFSSVTSFAGNWTCSVESHCAERLWYN